MGHKLYKELSCVKCQKTFHKRISLALHNAEFHKNDRQKKKNSKSRKSGIVDDVCSLSGNSSSSEDVDVELSKQFKADVKDETEDELVSSDDEFNEAWEKENLPDPKKICRGPGTNKQNGLKNLPEVQVYRKGEWEWMLDHNLFSPTVVVEDSLNAAMRRNKEQPTSSESDESFDTIESILGPDSDEELTKMCEENLNDFIALNENQPNCDKRETIVSNNDADDEEVIIDLLSSESEEESEEYPNTANNDDQRNTDDENLNQLESDPKFNCTVLLNDFVTENLLQQLKTKYNFKFDFPDPMSSNDGNNCTPNGCESDSESSGSCIVLSSSDDDLDDDEVLPDDYDDYSDDDCCIVDDDCNTETILPHFPNDIIEIVD